MSRIIGMVILSVGGFIFYQAFDGWGLILDRVSKLLTGGQVDQVFWHEVGGVVCMIVGLLVANSSRPD